MSYKFDDEVERGLYSALIVLAQAAIPTAPPLIDLTGSRGCKFQDPVDDEIVVCGRRDVRGRYRIRPASTPDPYLPKAKATLFDSVGISAETERAEVGGVPSNRIMLRLKFPF